MPYDLRIDVSTYAPFERDIRHVTISDSLCGQPSHQREYELELEHNYKGKHSTHYTHEPLKFSRRSS